MGMISFRALLAIVPIALLLTVSYFVLLSLRKVDEKGLKAFGFVVVSLIWLAALSVFSVAVYKSAKTFMHAMPKSMCSKMCACCQKACSCCQNCACCGMQEKDKKCCLPSTGAALTAMSDKPAMAKDMKHSGMSKCGGNKGHIFKAE